MNIKLKSLGWVVPALLYTVTTSQSFAADTVCTLITKTTGVSTATVQTVTATQPTTLPAVSAIDLVVAVASNFYYPAIRFVTAFVENAVPDFGVTKHFGVCHNATGHLNSEIRGSNPGVISHERLSAHVGYNYGILLAANTATPNALVTDTLAYGPTQPYAMGVPTLYIRTGETVSNYIESVGSGPAAYYRGSSSFGPARLKPAGGPFAVAFPGTTPFFGSNAPYGAAGITVTTAMGNWPGTAAFTQITGNTVNGTCNDATDNSPPNALEITACAYDNVDLTKLAIETGANVKAGWTSWQQMFDPESGAPPAENLQFYTFPDYTFPQGYVILELSDSFSKKVEFEGYAYELTQFMKWETPNQPNTVLPGGVSWNTWLGGNGYGAL